ncbi:hypothetical protein VPNG_07589 [Cytospora leucostoma]|uniref:Uncharacterized protein n=1 Tax=Cytospora leucostoma TaxID=1230097 RepID=A0A423WDX3_9PEZI|nr:hypothetical protein VPNG_07589 [Cytospora leucostoma]
MRGLGCKRVYLQFGDQDTIPHLVQDLAIPVIRSQRFHAPLAAACGRDVELEGAVGLATVLYIVGTVVAASEEGRPRAGVTMLVSFSLPLEGLVWYWVLGAGNHVDAWTKQVSSRSYDRELLDVSL